MAASFVDVNNGAAEVEAETAWLLSSVQALSGEGSRLEGEVQAFWQGYARRKGHGLRVSKQGAEAPVECL